MRQVEHSPMSAIRIMLLTVRFVGIKIIFGHQSLGLVVVAFCLFLENADQFLGWDPPGARISAQSNNLEDNIAAMENIIGVQVGGTSQGWPSALLSGEAFAAITMPFFSDVLQQGIQ